MHKNSTRVFLGLVLALFVAPPLVAQSAQPKSATSADQPSGIVVVDFGQYRTKDPVTEIRPHWTLVKQTTDIKVQDGAGFGVRFSIRGPFDAKSEPRVKVTLRGAFGGVGGPIGYGFEMGCTMKEGACAGAIIWATSRPVQFGGFERLTAGHYIMHLEYSGTAIEKTFVLL